MNRFQKIVICLLVAAEIAAVSERIGFHRGTNKQEKADEVVIKEELTKDDAFLSRAKDVAYQKGWNAGSQWMFDQAMVFVPKRTGCTVQDSLSATTFHYVDYDCKAVFSAFEDGRRLNINVTFTQDIDSYKPMDRNAWRAWADSVNVKTLRFKEEVLK